MARVFIYGTELPGEPDAGWLAGLHAEPASVRGSLWVRQSRPALLPSPNAPHVEGLILDVPDPRLAVLDLLHLGNGLARARVTVRVGARGVDAEAWVLTKPPDRRSGWRMLKAPSWRAVSGAGRA